LAQGRRFMSTDGVLVLPAETHGVAGRYAGALWKAAARADSLDAVEKDLDQVASAIVPGEMFERFLKDPTISKKQKGEAMIEALSGSAPLTISVFGKCQNVLAPKCVIGHGGFADGRWYRNHGGCGQAG